MTACLASFCSYEATELLFYHCLVLYIFNDGSFFATTSCQALFTQSRGPGMPSAQFPDQRVRTISSSPSPEGLAYESIIQSRGTGIAVVSQSRGPEIIRA